MSAYSTFYTTREKAIAAIVSGLANASNEEIADIANDLIFSKSLLECRVVNGPCDELNSDDEM